MIEPSVNTCVVYISKQYSKVCGASASQMTLLHFDLLVPAAVFMLLLYYIILNRRYSIPIFRSCSL